MAPKIMAVRVGHPVLKPLPANDILVEACSLSKILLPAAGCLYSRFDMSMVETAGKRPKLGQHFLADGHLAARIVDALGDIAQSVVVEIGPGRGVMTSLLAARAGRLIAIELDRILAAQLRVKYARHENVEIIEADVLAVHFESIFGPRPGRLAGLANPVIAKAKIIGNIPYYITSELLLRLFDNHLWFDRMVLMTQLEVADRIVAKPGTRDYGLLSATAQLYTNVEKLFTVPPGAFAPPPKVQSAVLRLTVQPRWEQLQVEPGAFIAFLKLSFGQKRKILANNLKGAYPATTIKAALASAKVAADVRAEALSLEKAAAVFRALAK
jgi:16S rRNA (adenine1518-N6/adenine1519-N6)-dimethyltransferase